MRKNNDKLLRWHDETIKPGKFNSKKFLKDAHATRYWHDEIHRMFIRNNKKLMELAYNCDNLIINANARKELSILAYGMGLSELGSYFDSLSMEALEKAQRALEERLTPELEERLNSFKVKIG